MNELTHHHPHHLRERVHEAGGVYEWANDLLIRMAGPAQIGEGQGAPRIHCGRTRVEHVEHDGMLSCPAEG